VAQSHVERAAQRILFVNTRNERPFPPSAGAIMPQRPNRIAALRAETDAMRQLALDLSPEEWSTPSAAPGWSVKDVIAHLAATCRGMFNPAWTVRLLRTTDLEGGNNRDVGVRIDWTPAQVRTEYQRWSPRFTQLQTVIATAPAVRALRLRIGDLGRYPAEMLAAASVFDHWTHHAHDIVPVLDRPPPATDANRMATVVEWMLSGLEQMCSDSMKWADRTVDLTLTGPGGWSWTITPVGGGRLQVRPASGGRGCVHVTGACADFPLWATRRIPWQQCDIGMTGAASYGGRFLDSINII
jgi:uncharacterized protein (TIGR03083 family)